MFTVCRSGIELVVKWSRGWVSSGLPSKIRIAVVASMQSIFLDDWLHVTIYAREVSDGSEAECASESTGHRSDARIDVAFGGATESRQSPVPRL